MVSSLPVRRLRFLTLSVLAAVLSAFGSAAQASALQMRLGYGEGLGFTLGAGVEAPLRSHLALNYGVEVAPEGPGLAAFLQMSFKPDLGQYLPEAKGVRPYLGGGLAGLLGGGSTFGLLLTAGAEASLDPTTGLYLEGGYLYGFGTLPRYWRLGLGFTFR